MVHYVSIGHAIEPSVMQEFCAAYPKLFCQQVGYFHRGFEHKTLEYLHQYCSAHENSQQRVVYLHNKGSYHVRKKWDINQHFWRRAGTAAALTDMCLHPPDDSCDFCGLLVTPVPWLHIPGNFWTAKCSYIQKLLPPEEYRVALREYRQQFAEPLLDNRTMNMLFQKGNKREDSRFFGDERYSAEHWIGSHPSAIPCDVATISDMSYWQSHDFPLDTTTLLPEFNFSMAPRRDLQQMMELGAPPKFRAPRVPPYILKKPHLRIRDYHLLGGMITRWHWFYHEIPPPKSWIWSYYPDATTWQNGIAKFGLDHVFEKVAATVPAIGNKKPTQPTQQQ